MLVRMRTIRTEVLPKPNASGVSAVVFHVAACLSGDEVNLWPTSVALPYMPRPLATTPVTISCSENRTPDLPRLSLLPDCTAAAAAFIISSLTIGCRCDVELTG